MAPPRKPLATKERLAAIAAMSEDEFVLFAMDHLRQTGECTVTTSTAWSDDLTTDQQQNIVQKFR
jgi:HJR/Mrr/RecB family endonuclease